MSMWKFRNLILKKLLFLTPKFIKIVVKLGMIINMQEVFDDVDAEFAKFKKSAQKEVNYLVKEFECRKSADSYARATVSRTGVLDTAKLHTYRYNEDLFKKVTTLADGKNHGLVFVLGLEWFYGRCFVGYYQTNV